MMILKELPNSIEFIKDFIKTDVDDDSNYKYFALVRDPFNPFNVVVNTIVSKQHLLRV